MRLASPSPASRPLGEAQLRLSAWRAHNRRLCRRPALRRLNACDKTNYRVGYDDELTSTRTSAKFRCHSSDNHDNSAKIPLPAGSIQHMQVTDLHYVINADRALF